jgi:lactoylglutathione lyase
MPLLAFLHVKLDVQDLAASLEFYQGKLGLRPIVRYDRTDGITIVQLSPTGLPPGVELWYEPPHGPLETDRLHVAFAVEDVEGMIRQLRTQGIVIEREPFLIGHEVIAFIRDPDGYLIELNETDRATRTAQAEPEATV